MISEFFINLGASIAAWFLSLFGTDEPPTWLADVAGFWADLATRVEGLGAWVPLGFLGTVIVSLLGIWAVFWLVKGIRWLWGLTPLSGGS
ncbi:MAG: hypothetical protein K0Q52_1907 [Microbacterium sp.]|nr:hypothetical protein [Microbacterium sp.]